MQGLLTDGPVELWNRIQRAATRGYYNSREEFDALPDACKRFVGSPEGLKSMAIMDEEVFATVTRGQFLRQAEMLIVQEEQRRNLPSALIEMAAQIGRGMPMSLLDEPDDALLS